MASATVTVLYLRKRWWLEFSQLPDKRFGPYGLGEASRELQIAALLSPTAARDALFDAVENSVTVEIGKE